MNNKKYCYGPPLLGFKFLEVTFAPLTIYIYKYIYIVSFWNSTEKTHSLNKGRSLHLDELKDFLGEEEEEIQDLEQMNVSFPVDLFD